MAIAACPRRGHLQLGFRTVPRPKPLTSAWYAESSGAGRAFPALSVASQERGRLNFAAVPGYPCMDAAPAETRKPGAAD